MTMRSPCGDHQKVFLNNVLHFSTKMLNFRESKGNPRGAVGDKLVLWHFEMVFRYMYPFHHAGTVPWNGLHPREIMGEVLESGSSLPLDTEHLGRNLHSMLAAGLNSDITVRSTLSIDQIREVLARVYQVSVRTWTMKIKVLDVEYSQVM